jgi:hypothetical protein
VEEIIGKAVVGVYEFPALCSISRGKSYVVQF